MVYLLPLYLFVATLQKLSKVTQKLEGHLLSNYYNNYIVLLSSTCIKYSDRQAGLLSDLKKMNQVTLLEMRKDQRVIVWLDGVWCGVWRGGQGIILAASELSLTDPALAP